MICHPESLEQTTTEPTKINTTEEISTTSTRRETDWAQLFDQVAESSPPEFDSINRVIPWSDEDSTNLMQGGWRKLLSDRTNDQRTGTEITKTMPISYIPAGDRNSNLAEQSILLETSHSPTQKTWENYSQTREIENTVEKESSGIELLYQKVNSLLDYTRTSSFEEQNSKPLLETTNIIHNQSWKSTNDHSNREEQYKYNDSRDASSKKHQSIDLVKPKSGRRKCKPLPEQPKSAPMMTNRKPKNWPREFLNGI